MRTCRTVDFAVPADQRELKDKQVPRPCSRNKKAVEHEGEGDTNYNGRTGNDYQRLGTGVGRFGNQTQNKTIC